MSHVQIRMPAPNGDRASVVVDGVEMAQHIMADGFAVDIPSGVDQTPTVSMVVHVRTLEIDLPDAVVVALRAPENHA